VRGDGWGTSAPPSGIRDCYIVSRLQNGDAFFPVKANGTTYLGAPTTFPEGLQKAAEDCIAFCKEKRAQPVRNGEVLLVTCFNSKGIIEGSALFKVSIPAEPTPSVERIVP
jgi:hypothetical protein